MQVLRMLGSTVDPPAYRAADRSESIQKFKDNWAIVGGGSLKYTMEQMATAENAYNRYKDDEARATAAGLGTEPAAAASWSTRKPGPLSPASAHAGAGSCT